MSEFLAEAAVLIRPDTTKFRAELLAELEAATKGIIIPIRVAPATTAVRETRKVAAATEQATVATQRKAAADAVATKEAVNLAEAQRLGAVAASKLAAVEDADALAVTALAGSKTKLRAAEAAVIAARRASTAALAVENKELEANVAATLASAEAEVTAARAAAGEAVAHAKGAKEVAGHAAAEHALARGAGATGLSLLGARGATLAASSAFLVGAASVVVFEKAIHEASAEAEAGARTNKVFGESAAGLEKDAAGMADSFGLSARAALDFESKLGNLLTNAGFARKEAAGLSETLVKLASDEAAFQNVPVADVLRAIQLGLVGNSRGLRQYQIELNQARVNQEALRISGKESVKALTQEDKIRARVNLLLAQTVNIQGAAADRAGGLAQQEKVLRANLENLGGTIGRAVIPPVTELTGDLTDLVGVLGDAGNAAESFAKKLDQGTQGRKKGLFAGLESFVTSSLPKQIAFFKSQLKGLDTSIKGEGDTIETNTKLMDLHLKGLHVAAETAFRVKVIQDFSDALLQAADNVQKIVIRAANISFKNAISEAGRLGEKLTDIRIAGGPNEQGNELAVLQRQAAAQQAAVDAAATAALATRGRSGHDTAVKRRRDAKQQLLDTISQIRAIQKETAQAAADAVQKIADDAKAAADLIQQLLDEADQAFLDALGLRQGALDIRQARVEATKSLVDDIAFQNTLQKFFLTEIAAAKKTISNVLLRAQTVQQLTAALVNSQIAEKQLRAQQAQERQQRKQKAFDLAAASIDLDIELAQTNKNVRAEIRARLARIKLDQTRLAAVKGDIIATKRLRNDIAAQRAAIKALKGEVDQRRKDLEALEFSFLQTQSGFAATLLSNLLPTGALAGTVGGATSAGIGTTTSDVVPPANFAKAAHQRPLSQDVTTTQQAGASPRGASQAQMAVLIAINRGILTALGHIVGQRTHPEATKERIRDSVSLDVVGW